MFRSRLGCAVGLTLAVYAAGNETATADTISLAPQKDNTLYESATGARSNGAGSAMFAGRTSQASDSIRRALISFDLASQIPALATINSVSLTLNNSAANGSDETLSLYRVSSDWGEGTSVAGGGQGGGASSATGDATWMHTFFATDSWATPGGDFAAAPSAATLVGGAGEYTWNSTPQLVSDAQSFLDDNSGNFGWILVGNESSPSTAKRFATRESNDSLLVPTLTVDYTPVPEPTTGMLVAIIAAAVFPRRRHGAI